MYINDVRKYQEIPVSSFKIKWMTMFRTKYRNVLPTQARIRFRGKIKRNLNQCDSGSGAGEGEGCRSCPRGGRESPLPNPRPRFSDFIAVRFSVTFQRGIFLWPRSRFYPKSVDLTLKEISPGHGPICIYQIIDETLPRMYCIVYIAVDVKDIDEASDTIGAFFEAKINRITQVRLKTTGVYIS